MDIQGNGISSAEIQRRASEASFGKPLITNVLRGHVAEAIIASALEPEWHWCSADYTGWDFERRDGVRLEVKQSAARQSWAMPASRRSTPSFDIAPRQGYWKDGITWVPEPGRQAHLYVFAWHAIDDESADHRLPDQWRFYVAAANKLPDTRRIGLAMLERLTSPCNFAHLPEHVARVAAGLRGTAA